MVKNTNKLIITGTMENFNVVNKLRDKRTNIMKIVFGQMYSGDTIDFSHVDKNGKVHCAECGQFVYPGKKHTCYTHLEENDIFTDIGSKECEFD
jgi:hypothetical protein